MFCNRNFDQFIWDCIYHEGSSWDVSYIKFALCIEPAFYSDSRTIYFYYEHRIYCGADCTFGREFEKRQILQIGVNIVFSWFIDVSMKILQGFVPEEGAAQLLSLFIGCVILAFGISMEVAPNVLLVPGEGIVKALSKVCQKRFGTVKVVFDTSLISISFVLSFLFFHRLNGLGDGTVISALVVEKMVNICNHLPVIHKISAL